MELQYLKLMLKSIRSLVGAMEADVVPAEVVGDDDDNVGRFATGCSRHKHEQDCRQDDVAPHLRLPAQYLQFQSSSSLL